MFHVISYNVLYDMLERFAPDFSRVSNNSFLYFLANDKNSYPLTYFLVLGSIEYCVISIY